MLIAVKKQIYFYCVIYFNFRHTFVPYTARAALTPPTARAPTLYMTRIVDFKGMPPTIM